MRIKFIMEYGSSCHDFMVRELLKKKNNNNNKNYSLCDSFTEYNIIVMANESMTFYIL